MSASIGIALGQTDPDALLRDADVAVYRAKADGRGRLRAVQRQILTSDLDSTSDLDLTSDLDSTTADGGVGRPSLLHPSSGLGALRRCYVSSATISAMAGPKSFSILITLAAITCGSRSAPADPRASQTPTPASARSGSGTRTACVRMGAELPRSDRCRSPVIGFRNQHTVARVPVGPERVSEAVAGGIGARAASRRRTSSRASGAPSACVRTA